MSFHNYKNFRFSSVSVLTVFLLVAGFLLVPFTTSCSAFVSQMSEEQAAQILRNLTKDGKLPAESAVLDIENRYAKTRTGALAKLLRARIHFENNDFAGAADILNANVFQKTNVGDYALWLRGRALQQAGRDAEAMSVFAELVKNFPTSIRAREAKLLWANTALQSGQTAQIPTFLKDLIDKSDADALLFAAKSFDAQGNQAQAINFYRKVYFYGAGTDAGKEAEAKLVALGQNLAPQTAEEILARADKFFAAKSYKDAADAYANALSSFPNASTAQINLKRLTALVNSRRMPEAQSAFNTIPLSAAPEKAEGYYQLARGLANAKLWEQARSTVEEMRQKFPASDWTPKTLIDVGMIARDAKDKTDESYLLKTAVAAYPNSVAVAPAQFELAWMEHDNDNFQASSQMLTEHLARYADKDSTNRGKAGYWAARDSEKAGKTAEACALYDGVLYRYAANWYGYLATQRIANLKAQNKCQNNQQFPADSLIGKAVANLKTVTVAPETATEKELERSEKSEQLSTIGLFDWAIDELKEAQKTAPNSPKVNLALAKHFRLKQDNTSALLALAKSYPDYSQMFPEEMGREEWDIFYPLTNWQDIKYWAKARNLDAFQIAGFIRQETIFSPRAKSGASAFGLMQLLIPTARAVAKKYNSTTTDIYAETLFQSALNIELGTAYIRDQFDKFGRVEFVAVAYNAGPGRVSQWQATLPFEMDEFVEAIPFKETKGYVQGIIRNSAQYRRLYDDNGNFKPNVGTRPLRGEIDSKTPEQIAAEFPDVVIGDKAE